MDNSFFESQEFKAMCKLYYSDKERDMDKWVRIVGEIKDKYTCRDYCYKWLTYDVMPYADVVYAIKWSSEIDKKNFEKATSNATERKGIVMKGRIIDVEKKEEQYVITLVGLDESFSNSNKSKDILDLRNLKKIKYRIEAYQAVQGRKHTIGELDELKPGQTIMISLLNLDVPEFDERCIFAHFTDIMPDGYLDNIYLDKNLFFRNESNVIVEYAKHPLCAKKPILQENRKDEATQSEGCYIATAVYQSYDCPEVWTLRRFRDNVLRKTKTGCEIVNIYYKISPKLVEKFSDKRWFTHFWKKLLDCVVEILQLCGMDNTRYEDE